MKELIWSCSIIRISTVPNYSHSPVIRIRGLSCNWCLYLTPVNKKWKHKELNISFRRWPQQLHELLPPCHSLPGLGALPAWATGPGRGDQTQTRLHSRPSPAWRSANQTWAPGGGSHRPGECGNVQTDLVLFFLTTVFICSCTTLLLFSHYKFDFIVSFKVYLSIYKLGLFLLVCMFVFLFVFLFSVCVYLNFLLTNNH